MSRLCKDAIQIVLLGLIGCMVLGLTAEARAGMITAGFGADAGSGKVLDITIVTPKPGNDNMTTASPNLVSFNADFARLAPTDIVFRVADTKPGRGVGPTTEYYSQETVTNNTASMWTGFHFQLGFRSGTAFFPANPGNNLDFDFPHHDPSPTSTRFRTWSTMPPPKQTTSLVWSGGSVSPGQSVSFTFSIDVPNRNQLRPGGDTEFTLREGATDPPSAHLPEPGTITLCAVGGLVLLGFRLLRWGLTRAARRAVPT